eukprot:CAMPEP_0113902958 /NCGR_PEP_ID=MMETSP0780_2-20120614/22181_1 /TAXON_ID=652834 /ORGANISM="Palpitomonas bilix" /LENGTH=133 /DNA_ID=CAMNT_0000895905 /DNA_START=30 /DNA_END=428 /DNA_ORIENTATION=- /assembly_acc=CAM_ASM_000599
MLPFHNRWQLDEAQGDAATTLRLMETIKSDNTTLKKQLGVAESKINALACRAENAESLVCTYKAQLEQASVAAREEKLYFQTTLERRQSEFLKLDEELTQAKLEMLEILKDRKNLQKRMNQSAQSVENFLSTW